jgi:release factor glutamine methyltransferase
MNQTAFIQLVTALIPRYGEGEARSIARIVLEDAFQVKAYSTWMLPDAEQPRFNQLLGMLLKGIPVQYAVGKADFFGLSFKVNSAVLIPRQETEELVDWALSILKKSNQPKVLDIGVGSGCIGITLKHRKRDVVLWGLEKSSEALEVARENARSLLGEQEVYFRQGDILAEAAEELCQPWDLIVSNPPYIPREEAALLPEHVLLQEPSMALFVEGDDPLLFYRKISNFAVKWLQPEGCLLFECNEFNAKAVVKLLENNGFCEVELRKDLSGADRMVAGKKPINSGC